MRKLSIKSIIEFRGKSERGKKKFANDLKSGVAKAKTDGGGDYWITSLSAISNSYKRKNLQPIRDKISQLDDKLIRAKSKLTKVMYQRNIDILNAYLRKGFEGIAPNKKVTYLTKIKANSILTIKGLPVLAIPHHVFAFDEKGKNRVGAIWFIAKLGGYKVDEVGMFSEALYRYLRTNFSDDYVISPKYCLAIDVANTIAISYSQIQREEIPAILTSTIGEIKRFM